MLVFPEKGIKLGMNDYLREVSHLKGKDAPLD